MLPTPLQLLKTYEQTNHLRNESVLFHYVIPYISITYEDAIHAQSGSLFTDWGWFLSERRAGEIRDFIKDKAGCLSNTLVYDCLRGRTAKEVQAYRLQYDLSVGNFAQTQWHPYPDNDFFSSDIVLENYNFPIRLVNYYND